MVDPIRVRMMNVVADDTQVASRWLSGITVPSEDPGATGPADFNANDFETLHPVQHDLVRFGARQALFCIGTEAETMHATAHDPLEDRGLLARPAERRVFALFVGLYANGTVQRGASV